MNKNPEHNDGTGQPVRCSAWLGCPWCGKQPKISPPGWLLRWWEAECDWKLCQANPVVSGDTEGAVLEMWNTRRPNDES